MVGNRLSPNNLMNMQMQARDDYSLFAIAIDVALAFGKALS